MMKKKMGEAAKNWKLLYISPFSLDEYIMKGFASREKQIGSRKFRVNASKNHSIFINCGNGKKVEGCNYLSRIKMNLNLAS